jgi:hypothetical protein
MLFEVAATMREQGLPVPRMVIFIGVNQPCNLASIPATKSETFSFPVQCFGPTHRSIEHAICARRPIRPKRAKSRTFDEEIGILSPH